MEREREVPILLQTRFFFALWSQPKKQSRSGLVAVGKAFAALGEDKAASMVLSRVGKDWVEEANDSTDIVSPSCWDK